MAIDYSDYVRNYAPPAQNVGAGALERGASGLMKNLFEDKRYQKLLKRKRGEEEYQYNLEQLRKDTEAKRKLTGAAIPEPEQLYNQFLTTGYTTPLSESYEAFRSSMFDTDGSFKDHSEWLDVSFKNEGEALKDLLALIPAENKAMFQQRGWLDPLKLRNQYATQVANYGARILSDLNTYAVRNKLDANELRKIIDSKPELRQLLTNLPQKVLMQSSLITESLMPKSEPWKEAVEGLGDWFGYETPGKFVTTAAAGGAAVYAAPKIKEYYKSKKAGKETAEEVIKGGKKKGKKKALNKAKSKTIKTMMSGLVDKVEKHGALKLTRYIAKKRGWKFASRTVAKIMLGTAGLATGGALTAAMMAWSAKDVYDVYNDIMEMDSEEQQQNALKENMEETIKASEFYK
jgi:hypothetical protein